MNFIGSEARCLTGMVFNRSMVFRKNYSTPATLENFKELVDEIYKIYNGISGSKGEALLMGQADYELLVGRIEKMLPGTCVMWKDANDYVVAADGGDSSVGEWRIYLNFPVANFETVAGFIVGNLLQVVAGFKFARNVDYLQRCSDPLVVYTYGEQKCLAAALALGRLGGFLQDPTPEVTRRIIPGMGVGESPRDFQISFGKLRSIALARALYHYFSEVTGPEQLSLAKSEAYQYFEFIVSLAFDVLGIDKDRPYRNSRAVTKVHLRTILETPLINLFVELKDEEKQRLRAAYAKTLHK